MKFFKYLAIIVAVAGLLATVSWYLRNTLIQRLSSPILKDYDIEIVDVSLDALSPSRARIGRLELLHAKGTTIVIDGLSTRFSREKSDYSIYSADRITIVTETRDQDAPFELAMLIDQFLTLTNTIPRTDIHVGEFSLAPYPPMSDVDWVLSETGQEISGTIESVKFSLEDAVLDSSSHQVTLSLPGQANPATQEIVGKLVKSDQRLAIIGEGRIDLPAWQPLLKLASIVPDNIAIKGGTAEIGFGTQIPYDVSHSPSLNAVINQITPWQFDHIGKAGEATEVLVRTASTVEIDATYPTPVEWSISLAQAALSVSDGDWQAVPVTLSNLSCRFTLHCEMKADISWPGANLPFGKADNFDMSTTLSISFPGDVVRVDMIPEATLSIKSLASDATNIGVINASLASIATLTISDAGWTFSADSLDAGIRSLSTGENVLVTADVFFERLMVTELDQPITASMGFYAPGIRAALGDQTIELPGLSGSTTIEGTDFLFDLETVGLQKNGAITARYDIEQDTGSVEIDTATVSFASKKVSARFSPWRNDWDLVGGVVSIGGSANWRPSGNDTVLDGRIALQIADAAGFYANTVFTGLSTDLKIAYEDGRGFTTQPASIRVAVVDAGLPVENLTADYGLDLNELSVDVENLRMSAFGGTVRADPFSFRTASDRNNLTLHAELIRLDEVLSLKEFESVSVTGSVNATLPVTIEENEITVTGGRLVGEAPGGVIRYRSASAPSVTSTSSIDLVSRALSNFVYESLTSEVDYNETGDLILKMQIKGRNPDMEGNRPVILNLGVENNVPQMLRSLQAARAVEEVLEKRVKK